MIAISVDELEDALELREELGLSYQLASDPDGQVVQAYGVWDAGNEIAWPALFLVANGTIQWRILARDADTRWLVSDTLKAVKAALEKPEAAKSTGSVPSTSNR